MIAHKLDKPVRQAVDRLLLEQGVYTPLELLLAEGRLLFGDYERWREGEVEWLDELLFGDPQQSQELLQQAESYAAALGLVCETLHYHPWGAEPGRLLRFSPQAGLDRLFHARYRKPADEPQLDLFMDATGTTLVNGILAALTARDPAEARRLLQGLLDADPGNSQLGELEQLVQATARLDLAVDDASAELKYLQEELIPLAGDLLGAGSRDFITPFWRRLGETLEGRAFDPRQPALHASHMALQAEDWPQVKAVIEGQAGWREQPRLLRRYARACGRLQQAEQAVACWFLLCWRFPDQAAAIGREAEPIWRQRWQRFNELDPELPERDFPAWSLLEQPGLAKRLTAAAWQTKADTPEDYRITAELVSAGAAAVPAADLIKQRGQLKELNPNLFIHYLERFGRG